MFADKVTDDIIISINNLDLEFTNFCIQRFKFKI